MIEAVRSRCRIKTCCDYCHMIAELAEPRTGTNITRSHNFLIVQDLGMRLLYIQVSSSPIYFTHARMMQGYITMAQARHAMGGPKSVSSLQYDAVMTPLVSVEVSSEAKTYDKLLVEVESGKDWAEFKVNRFVPGKPVRKSRLSESDESADSGGGLRQRKRTEDLRKDPGPMVYEMRSLEVEDATKEIMSLKLKDNETRTYESNEQLKDPMKWFGVLVPRTLRQSQKHFVTGI